MEEPTVDEPLRSPTDSESDHGDGSSHSTTPNSTSTYRYSHEPFSTFQSKVDGLATEIGASKFEQATRLPGGGYNRIISITIQWSQTDENHPNSTKAVLRIPRFPDDEDLPSRDIQDQAAVLNFIVSSGLPAPTVLAFDSTRENALGMPYTLQTLLPGTQLDFLYNDMTFDEKIQIIDQVVDVLAHMDKCRFPGAGRLVCEEPAIEVVKSRLTDFTVTRLSKNVEVRSIGVGLPTSRIQTSITSSLYNLFIGQFDAWLTYEQSVMPDSPTVKLHGQLITICNEMADMGLFLHHEEDHSVLYHWDLEPRNILVERADPSSEAPAGRSLWRITGIIDWDDALCVPPILTRKPPVWIWDFADDDTLSSSILENYDGDVDDLPPSLYEENGTRITAEEHKLKKHFEEKFGKTMYVDKARGNGQIYLDDAYGRGRWLRRLWRFALEGFSDTQHDKRFKKLEKDWADYKASQSAT